jgi:hypothetical protein
MLAVSRVALNRGGPAVADQDPWSGVQLQEWQDNPGQPTGVGQVAPEIAANQQAQANGQPLDPWASVDFTSAAQSWFGGRNTQGTQNGWDSPFYRETIRQQDEWLQKAKDANSPSLYYSRFDTTVNREATGIVTWDDEAKGLRAGDVFENGTKTGNLFDLYGERDAATMLAPLLFDGTEQARLFEQGDAESNQPLIDATRERIAQMTQQVEKAPSAEAFRDLTAEKREMLDEGVSDVGSAAAGAGAGAAAGAGIGALFGGVGAVPGAVIGAGIGAFTSWLNRDQLTEMSARTLAQAQVAGQQDGALQAGLAHLSGWSGVAMQAASPLQNSVQGAFDATSGELGDGIAAFYEVDENGDRLAGGGVQTISMIASVGDAFTQFASAPARGLFYASMGAQVVAGLGETATGTVFDPTAGRYDELEGFGERAAQFASVGIDAVQLGVARALVRSTAAQRSLVGADEIAGSALQRAAQRTMNAGGTVAVKMDQAIDRTWAKARGVELPPNYTTKEVNGIRFFFGEDLSTPVTQRLTAQIIAPSEFTKWLPTGWRARNRMAAGRGMPTADDMYTAALEMAQTGNRLSNASINAFGEAAEEGAQAFLDPITYGESAGLNEVAQGAAMGFAAGFGMSLGATLKAPGMSERAQLAARRNLEIATGKSFASQKDWVKYSSQMSPQQLRIWAMADRDELQALADSAAEAARLHLYETGTHNVIGVQGAEMVQTIAERAAWNRSVPTSGGIIVALPRTNTFVLAGDRLESAEFEANEAVMSLWRVAELIMRKAEATELHTREALARIEEAQGRLAAATEQGDQDAIERETAEINEIQGELADIQNVLQVQQDLAASLRKYWDDFRNAPSESMRAQVVEGVNKLLRDLGQGRNGDGSDAADELTRERNMRAVEVFFGRHPYMDTGSVVRLVPQVSATLSVNNQHGSIHMPQTSLQVMGADYDGDFLANLNMAYIPPSKRREFRLGGQYLPTKGDTVSGSLYTVEMAVPDAELFTLNQFRLAYLDPGSAEVGFIETELADLEQWLRDRYEPVLGSKVVDAAWAQFRADVKTGSEKARLRLTETLLNADVQKFVRMGESTAVPEANRLMERISLSWERISMATAAYNHTTLENDDNLEASQIAEQRAFIRDRQQTMTDTYGAMIALGLSADGQRSAQQINYLAMLQSALRLEDYADTGAAVPDWLRTLAYEYQLLSSGSSVTSLEEVDATDIIGTKVRGWLLAAADQFRREADSPATADMPLDQLALLVGSMQVRAFNLRDGGVEFEDGNISILQMLLRVAVQQEEARLSARNEPKDTPVWRALQKARRLTTPEKSGHSYTASAALLHVYGPQRMSSLVGENYALVGPDVPVDVIVTQLTSKHEDFGRADLLNRITRLSPAWEAGVSDPPYAYDKVVAGEISPYTVVVNAMRAVANRNDRNLADRNEVASKNAVDAFAAISDIIDAQTDEVAARLRQRSGDQTREISRGDVLAELLTYDMELGRLIALLIPVDAMRATFAIDQATGMPVVAKWVNDALLSTPAVAAKKFFYHSHLDHLRLLGAGVRDLTDEEANPLESAGERAEQSGVPLDKVTSRFQQTVLLAQFLAAEDGGMALLELQQAYDSSDTLEQMFEKINNNPRLRSDRAKLLPYYDDVADFELRPTDMFSKQMSSATMRDQRATAADRLKQMAASRRTAVAARQAEAGLVQDMVDRIVELGGTYDETNNPRTKGLPAKPVDRHLDSLMQAIKLAPFLVDGVGPAARDQAMAAVQEGLLIMSNKGAGDPNLSLTGAMLPLVSSFGLKQGLLQEIDNLTVFEIQDVMSNLSKLAEGPTRVALSDGSQTVIDATSVAGLVSLLADPTTNALAKAIVFPTVRDVTGSGTIQLYSVYDTSAGLESLLAQTSNAQFLKNGSKVTTEDAHKLLSMVEAMALKMVEHLPAEDKVERQSYTLAIQNILNDFLVAYAVGPRKSGGDKQVRDKLVRDVAQALVEIAQLPEKDRDKAKTLAVKRLVEQLTGTKMMADLLDTDPDTLEQMNLAAGEFLVGYYREREQTFADRIAASTDPIEIAEIEAEQDALTAIQAQGSAIEQLLSVDVKAFMDISTVRRMFEMDWTDEDTAQESAQRIAKFLTTNGRLLHFRQPKMMVAIHNIQNVAQLFLKGGPVSLEMLGSTPEEMKENWALVSEWASRAYIQDRLSPTAMQVGFSALKTDQEDAYYDPTYSFLLDKLFDDRLLEATRRITDAAQYNMGNAENINADSVAKRIVNSLFNRDLVTWRSPLYPSMALTARKALAVTPVESAVPQAGDNPKNLADAIGASWASYKLPAGDEYFSSHVITGKAGDSVLSLLSTTPEMFVKLQNHFVRAIRIVDSAGTLPPAEQDALLSVGRTGLQESVVESSPYRVLSLDRLQVHLDALIADYGIKDFVVEIEYVDVDKIPHEREWANNIFFEGVGRQYETNASNSLVGSLFFTTGALNKEGQQIPLEYSKKAGSGFLSYIMQARGRADQIEAQASSVTELMYLKALELWTRTYETGTLQLGDLPSLHKYMKMRHVIERPDSEGVVRRMLADEAIALEQAERAAGKPVSPYKVIPLGERTARTVWAANSVAGLPGRYAGQPVLNPQDVDPFPVLTQETLERRGLARLGEQVPVNQSEFAQIALLPTARLKEAEETTAKAQRTFITLDYNPSDALNARATTPGFDTKVIREINAKHDALVRALFERERGLNRMLAGISTTHAENDPTSGLTDVIAQQAAQLRLSDSNVTFLYRMGDVSGMMQGVLTKADKDNDFGWKGDSAVKLVMGDAVIIDLGNVIESFSGDLDKAFDHVTEVLHDLGKRQVRIAFQSSSGGAGQLRSDLVDWIEQGGIPYQMMQSSRHFFEPTTERNSRTRTERAIERSLSTTEVFTAKGAQLALVIPDESAAHDGTVYVDFDTLQDWASEAVGVFPSHLSNVAPGRNRDFAFGLVQDRPGDANVVARMRDDLLSILDTPEGRASLKMQDPQGVPVRQVTQTADDRELVTPGIIDADSALVELARVLRAGEDLYTNRTLRPGDIVPYTDATGNVILYRWGFRIPKDKDIARVLNGEPVAYPGATRPIKIVVTQPELEPNVTLPPDFLVEKLYYTSTGIRATGKARIDKNYKMLLQSVGAKLGMTEIPPHFKPALERLSLMENNLLRVNYLVGESSMVDKGATRYRIDNFSDAFAVFGMTFKQDLIDFFGLEWDETKLLLENWVRQGQSIGMTERRVFEMLTMNQFYDSMRDELRGAFGGVIADDALAQMFEFGPNAEENPQRRIVEVLLSVLLVPGMRVEHVLETSGLMNLTDLSGNAEVVRMPALIGMAFDDQYNFPKTFDLLMDRMNRRIRQPGTGKKEFVLNPDWTFSYPIELPGGGRGSRKGTLQMVLPIPAQQNVATYEQRYVTNQLANVSPHTAAVLAASSGARLPDRPNADTVEKNGYARVSTQLARWYDGSLLPPVDPGSLMSQPFTSPWYTTKDSFYDGWGMLNYSEHEAVVRGTEAVNQYLQPAVTTTWQTDDPVKYDAYRAALSKALDTLNLRNHPNAERLMHQLIRLELGIPGPNQDQDIAVGQFAVQDAVEALGYINEHLKNGELPTLGGAIPLVHADLLRVIFEAQQKPSVTKPWAPASVMKRGKPTKTAKTWDEWVETSIGQVMDSDAHFEAMHVNAMNGMWQSYNGVSPMTGTLTVTFETAKAVGLRNARFDGTMRDSVTFNLLQADELAYATITDTSAATLDVLSGKVKAVSGESATATYESRMAYHARRRAAWRAKKKMVKQDETQSVRDLRREGARYLENNNRANVFMRNISMWSLINRMMNPGIWVSGLIELPVRRSMEYFTNVLTGQSLGRTGEALGGTATHRYTDEEVKLLNDLIKRLGDNALFIAEIQNQLTYSITGPRSKRSELGGFSGKLEDAAGAMTRWMSDPWTGMRGDAMAREYLTAVMEYLASTNNAVTVKTLVKEMTSDPLWLKHNFREDRFSPHKSGMARVAQIRTMKPTMIAKPIMGPINNLMARPSATANIAGHLLHIPFMFLTFNANTLTTLTGMAGWDQAMAMFFDRRRKPKFLQSRANRALGDEGVEERWNFEDVIETIDLQRTFIRSGVTSSMVMALALMAGNLGLDGEDEEAKRRERLARYLNVPTVNDPYEPQNSFKYARAIFLDSIPGLDMIFKDNRGEAAVVPHWIIRQFTSPILGMQRFFDTGDIREIGYGFWDAFSVIPNSVLRTWEDADAMASQLADMAQAESQYDSEEARLTTNQLLVNIVTTYEKAILENSFVNTLYTATDDFDRNPYLIPGTTDTGTILREQGTGLPVATTATVDDVDAQGNPVTRYMKRTPDQAQLYAYTENNATAAVISSLFTGLGESDYLRKNMVVKERIITMPETSEAQATALFLAAYKGGGGSFSLNKEETIRVLKAQAEAEGIRWEQDEIEDRADAIIAAHSPELALSIRTEDGEVVTPQGAEAIYRSLAKGSIQLGDPALKGVAISVEVREAVAAKILNEIQQDAVNMGLSYESAQYVARRFWYGDPSNPQIPGLRDIIQSQDIPINNRVTYNQLNVMYAIGPDGRPWATPFERSNVAQAFGIPIPHRVELPGPGSHLDNLGNVVDDVLGINTGISAIVRQPNPPIELEDPFKAGKVNSGSAGSSNGGRRFGSGSGGSSYFPPFIRMDDLPYGTSSRYGGIPMVNTSNPYIRRAQVNRERVFGERGRLKQWQ